MDAGIDVPRLTWLLVGTHAIVASSQGCVVRRRDADVLVALY